MKREWRLSEELLLRLRDDVRSHGKRLLIALYPSEVQASRSRWRKAIANVETENAAFDIDKPNKRLQDFCRAHDIPFLDPLPAFRNAVESGQALYLPKDHHWNVKGHRLAAEVILADLRQRGWLMPPARGKAP